MPARSYALISHAPAKNWKLSAADVHERKFWDSYQHAYGELLTHTSAETAPWYMIPADHKWFSRVAVASIIVAELDSLGLTYPHVSDQQRETSSRSASSSRSVLMAATTPGRPSAQRKAGSRS